jgi:hypothetical protein
VTWQYKEPTNGQVTNKNKYEKRIEKQQHIVCAGMMCVQVITEIGRGQKGK